MTAVILLCCASPLLFVGCGGAGVVSAAPPGRWQPMPILPDAMVFDVTDARFGAVPDDGKDDTEAIQAAIQAAATLEKSPQGKFTRQQIIYLPEGTYHISDTLACVMNNGNPWHIGRYEIPGSEGFQWIRGDGAGKTILRLRSAREIGAFGSAEAPKPVLQTARFTYDRKQSGNSKFQLWVTDLSVLVPEDQPHAVGLSYGVANMGAVKRVHIQAEGNGGHTGLALVQNNNGPGMVEDVRIEGFSTGMDINDPCGVCFYLKNIQLVNQKPNGVGMVLSDKVTAIENLLVQQQHDSVTGVVLCGTRSESIYDGVMAFLTLIGPKFHFTGVREASVPAVRIDQGHLYMRGADFKGYGDTPIEDHGILRPATNGELVLVHGHSKEEKSNVVVTVDGAPAKSLYLPLKPTPEIPVRAWERLGEGDYTIVSQKDLKDGRLSVSTDWVVVKPSGSDTRQLMDDWFIVNQSGSDDTQLLQAALDSGARYIGILNGTNFVVKDTLHVNRPGTPGNVELIYGHMSNIILAGSTTRQPPYTKPNDYVGLHLHTGRHEQLVISGLQLLAGGAEGSRWEAEDFQVIQNDAACTVVFEDIRAKAGPRSYRNGTAAEGQAVFFDNCEFAYYKAFPQELMVFKKQFVWARNLNVEDPILDREFNLPGLKGETHRFLSATRVPRMVNDGGQVFTIGQKLGEHGGTFMLTRGGGKTELLSFYLNEKTSRYLEPSTEGPILRIEGSDSACSMSGAERTRNHTFPHKNAFARLRMDGAAERLLPCTMFPTMQKYSGYDPFEDTDEQRYLKDMTHRVFGLFRMGGDAWRQADAIIETIQEPQFPDYTVNVRELGAYGDGTHNDLPALQAAVDKCSGAGGGTVLVPTGTYWLEGPLHLKSHVNLQLEEDSILRFSADLDDFLPVVYTRWEGTRLFNYSPFIYANGVENVAITGAGTIDGNSEDKFEGWFEKQRPDQDRLRTMGDRATPVEARIFGEGHCLRPSFIQFIDCSRIKIEGVKIVNSPFWIIHPVFSKHITIHDVHIESMVLQNDGVDIDSSCYVLIENCTFRTGDDAVAIKSGRDREGRELARPSENIVIRNNTCLEVHNGFAIGSEMSGSVRNVFIENCTVESGRNLIFFKSNLDRGGVVENVHVRNISVGHASHNLIRFQTDYHGFRGGKHPPTFRNFRIENVTCKEAEAGIRVEGHVDSPITDVLIRNVTVEKAATPVEIHAHDQVDLVDVMINGKQVRD